MEDLRRHRKFCVMLPIVRMPDMLPFAVRSVLNQTENDFELCIICDGAPIETFIAARNLSEMDSRISVFKFPKGQRNGELHRAKVLEGASADFVAQIADDDLWFPDHLSQIEEGLINADFTSLVQISVAPDKELTVPRFGDLRFASTRAKMMESSWNFFGPTQAGYRLSAYRLLEVGWSPAPPDLPSDLFMWRKFLGNKKIRLKSVHRPTSLKFGAVPWAGQTDSQRAMVVGEYSSRLEDPTSMRELRSLAHIAVVRRIGGRDALRMMKYTPINAIRLKAAGVYHKYVK